jgi:hypothetical protein
MTIVKETLKHRTYWYAINLSHDERKHIRDCIKKDPALNGRVVLKAIRKTIS